MSHFLIKELLETPAVVHIKLEATFSTSVLIDFKNDQSHELIAEEILRLNEV